MYVNITTIELSETKLYSNTLHYTTIVIMLLCFLVSDAPRRGWRKLNKTIASKSACWSWYHSKIRSVHYNDVMMGAMASQITTLTIIYWIIYSKRRSKKTSKLRLTGLSAGNSSVPVEFPAQRASNAEMLPFDGVIMDYSWSIYSQISLKVCPWTASQYTK